MFNKKILMPHQYFYPHMDLFEDRCRGRDAGKILERIKNSRDMRRAMIYIHIPYCDSKCNFCGFDKQYNYGTMDLYVDKIIAELSLYASEIFEIESVHFGGGTPTLLTGSQLSKILNAVRREYAMTEDACVHMEGSCTSLYREDIIRFVLDEGIDRVSTGIQTFDPKLREILNQKSTLDQVYLTLETLKKNNIIVHGDILYGYPRFPSIGEAEDVVSRDVAEGIRMGLDGIDFSPVFPYSNRLEIIMREENVPLPYKEEVVRIMENGKEQMEAAGYAHETCYCFVRRGKIIMEANYYGGVKRMPDCIAVGSGSLGNICGFKYRNNSFNTYMTSGLPCVLQLKDMTAAEIDNMQVVGWPKLFSLSKNLLTDDTKSRFEPVLAFLKENGVIAEQDDAYVLTETAKYYADNIYFMMLPEKEREIVEKQLKILIMESEKGERNGDLLWNAGGW